MNELDITTPSEPTKAAIITTLTKRRKRITDRLNVVNRPCGQNECTMNKGNCKWIKAVDTKCTYKAIEDVLTTTDQELTRLSNE